jgi:hypothetical protein
VIDNVVEGFENSVPDGGLRLGSGDACISPSAALNHLCLLG